MALVALALVAFPSLRFVYLWVAGYEVNAPGAAAMFMAAALVRDRKAAPTVR